MKNFKNKVIVITGGATGIGFALAKQFGNEGAKIVICGIREDKVTGAVLKLKDMGYEASGKICDVSKIEQVEALADFAWDTYGHCDVIVNNAGVSQNFVPVIDTPMEEFHRVMSINLFGVIHGIKVFGKRFIEQGTPAAIYSVGSENSLYKFVPNSSAYGASKHALHAICDMLREEVPDFIDVALICPGYVTSEMTESVAPGMDTDEYVALVIKQLKRGEFYVVSHAYNIVRIQERHDEIRNAFAKIAPRYVGDDKYDVRTMLENMTG